MARKQTCGAQISRVVCMGVAFAMLFLAAQIWAQRGRATVSAVSLVDSEIHQTKNVLDSIRGELERGRARVKELMTEEDNYLARIEQIEKNIVASGQFIELAQEQIDTTEMLLVMLRDSLVDAQVELYRAQELMKKRIRAAYMTREINRWQMFFTAKSPTELLYRVRYFQEVLRYDRRLAENIQARISSVNEKRTEHEEQMNRLITLLNDRRTEQLALIDEETSRREVLDEVRAKREASAAMVAELEAAQAELDALMQILEARRIRAREEEERMATVNFENRKGKLPWPIRGAVTSKFGRVVHPVYKTVIMNNGISIAASKGAPVRSVAPGVVAHVGWMRGLGRLVIIDHGGGFMTLYAHLDDVLVAQDQSVLTAMEIGKAGETGTAGGPKLHFEIRRATESLDPEEWLQR